MSLIQTCTRRRVTVAMVGLLMLVFGLISLNGLKVNLLPDLSYPTLTVRTEYPGAAPVEMETLVTQPVEETLGVVKGLQRLRSVSRAGQADVLLEFVWGTDMDLAGLDVREKLEVLQLPLEARRPVLLRFNPATDPIMRLALYHRETDDRFDEQTLKEVRRFADEELKKRLEPIEGVAAVKVSGGLEDEIQINVDQARLAQLGLSIGDVARRLREENINISGGRLEQGTQRYLVRTVNQVQAVAEFGDLIIDSSRGRPIHLRDIATVRHGYKERQAVIRTNGREAVEIAVYKEGDANTVSVAEGVNQRLARLADELPQGLELELIDDQSEFIRKAISEVIWAALLGGILAILVIYFFLGDAWATVVISASIPLSIITTFFLMDRADLSLNIMSLGGIALAVGLLVDNAIVVLENIARHRSRGLGVMEAAVRGASEVSGAVVASTLTTIAVFLPLIFVQGIGGQLFRDQALTVTFALSVSLLVALTFIPMLSSIKVRSPVAFPEETLAAKVPKTWFGRMLRAIRLFFFARVPAAVAMVVLALTRSLLALLTLLLRPLAKITMAGFALLSAGYARLLPWALNHRSWVLLAAMVGLVAAVFLGNRLGAELIPQLAQGRFEMAVKLAPGTPLSRTDEVVAQIQRQGVEVPAIRTIHAVAGTGNRIDANPTEAGENIGDLLVVLDGTAGPNGEQQALQALRRTTEGLPGVVATFSRPQLFSFATPLEIELFGYDLDRLKAISQRVAVALADSDRFADVKSSLEQGHPEIQIRFDQERAAALGLTVREISDQVVRKLRGEVATRYSWRDRKIDVLVRVDERDRSSLEDVRRLIVNPRSDRPITLEAVAEILVVEGPAEINRIDQERAAIVSANLRYGTLQDAVIEAERILAAIELPYATSAAVAGQSEEMDASFRSLMFALGLAIFLVYLVMASQFESLIHPLVILFSIPLAVVGAILALWVTATPISVIVFIGAIMLAGIVVNNAIVLIDLINQLRASGMAKREAVVEAGRLRLRPIVMTTLTTVLGLLPLALGVGEGAEVRQPMAITVVGGLLVSTFLTLLVVPVVYDLLDRGKRVAATGTVADASSSS